jgi:hypothetical protein
LYFLLISYIFILCSESEFRFVHSSSVSYSEQYDKYTLLNKIMYEHGDIYGSLFTSVKDPEDSNN